MCDKIKFSDEFVKTQEKKIPIVRPNIFTIFRGGERGETLLDGNET